MQDNIFRYKVKQKEHGSTDQRQLAQPKIRKQCDHQNGRRQGRENKEMPLMSRQPALLVLLVDITYRPNDLLDRFPDKMAITDQEN